MGIRAVFARVRAVMSMAVVAAVLTSGCGGDGSSAGKGRTDLVVAVTSPTDSLDPAKTVSSLSSAVVKHVFEGLTRITPDRKVEPLLAERWEAGADGKTWTFYLRKGVKFHDGTPFNAEAVRINYQRILDPNNKVPLRANAGPIVDVKVVDDSTVQIVTKAPFSGLPIVISHMVALMVSPQSIQKWGEGLGNNASAGTGPFEIASFKIPDELVVKRNKNYWGTAPKLEKITFKSAPKAETRLAMLMSGEADMNFYETSEGESRLKSDDKYEVAASPSIRMFVVHLPMNLPEMQDLRVRQALNHAVDREQIVKTIYAGAARIADSSIGPGVIGYKSISAYPYDVARATELLKQAGWTKGPDGVLRKGGKPFPTQRLEASRGRYPRDAELAQAVAGYFQAIGLPVKLQIDEFASFYTPATQNAVKENWFTQMAWGYTTMDGASFLCQVYGNNNQNFSGYRNARLDEQCAGLQSTFDADKRSAMIGEGSEIVYADLPAIYLVVPAYLVSQKRGLKGVLLDAGENHRLANAYWEPSSK